MTTGQFPDLDRRVADFNSQQAAAQKNAAMRGDPPADPVPPYKPEPAKPDDIDEILRKHLRVTGENIRFREELAQARKARDAAQELLEAERQKNAALSDKLIHAEDARQVLGSTVVEYIGKIKELRLLRDNDRAEMNDLQRRLCEAEGQLKARRLSAENVAEIRAYEPRWAIDAKKRAEVVAENTELHKTIESQEVTIRQLKAQIETMPVTVRGEPTVARKMLEAELEEMRRTFRLIVGTTKEYFDLITELASDPADQARTKTTP